MGSFDVFAGAGGLSLGFEQAGFVSMLGVDGDERAVASYATNFPEAAAIAADVRDLSGGDLLSAAGEGRCTVVVGGPPCAAFSAGGLRDRGDARRGLVGEFARIVKEVRPRYFVMENVPGILDVTSRDVVAAFVCDMRRGGYAVGEPWLLDAAAFGVAQHRRRVFLVGALAGLVLPSAPVPGGAAAPSARDAIGDLELIEGSDLLADGSYCGPLGRPSAYAAALRGDRGGSLAPAAALTGCARVAHGARIRDRFGRVPAGALEPISRFVRLHPDRPSPTLRAGTLADRGSHTAPRPIHYAFPRCITVREAARLQSMPDWFCVDDTKWRGHMQVGNAVPPALARAVAGALRAAIGDSGT